MHGKLSFLYYKTLLYLSVYHRAPRLIGLKSTTEALIVIGLISSARVSKVLSITEE